MKSIYYKEWIKTRWYIFAILLLGIIIEAIMFLKLGRSFRFAGHEHLWDVIINQLQFLFLQIKFFPLAAGIVMAASQIMPEISDSRLKLSLHLPLKETKITTLLLSFGFSSLLGIFLITLIMQLIIACIYFPKEILSNMWLTLVPWYFAGLTAYFTFIFSAVEPVWKRKIINGLLSVFILWIFLIKTSPGAYQTTMLLMPVLLLISIALSYYSVYRYKTGVQAIYN